MKERLKWILLGVISACTVFAMSVSVFAVTSGSVSFNTVNLRHNGQQISAIGDNYTISSGVSVPASILYTDQNGGGTTYLPLARICSLLDTDIYWDGSTKSVYVGEKPRIIPEYYLEFPSIPNIESVTSGLDYYLDFDSEPEIDKLVGYASHHYTYRTKTIEEAENACKKYAQHLDGQGFFYILTRDNPIIIQKDGSNEQYIFYTPDGKYEIEFYSLANCLDGYNCEINVSIKTRISINSYERYIRCEDVVDFGSLIGAAPELIAATEDQKTICFYYNKHDYSSSDLSLFKRLLISNGFEQSSQADTYTKGYFTVQVFEVTSSANKQALAVAISHPLGI